MLMPNVRQMIPTQIAEELASVQPMPDDLSSMFVISDGVPTGVPILGECRHTMMGNLIYDGTRWVDYTLENIARVNELILVSYIDDFNAMACDIQTHANLNT